MVLLIVAPQAFAGGGFIKTIAAAQQKAKANKSLIFVDLFAEWCGWCHRFEREVVPSEAFQKATADMVLLRLDTEDRAEGTAFAQKFQIRTLPTFLILNHDMTLAGAIRGYAPPTEFSKMVTDTVTGHRNFQAMVKDEASFAKDYPKRLDLAKAFVSRQAYGDAESRFKKLISEKGVPAAFRDEAYYQLGSLYLEQGKYAQALKVANDFAAVQNAGKSFELSRILVGNVYLAQGNFKSAVETLRDFKAKFPQSPFVHDVDRVLPALERQLLIK
jgi:thioredoxin-related protein